MDPRTPAPPAPFPGLDVSVLRHLVEVVPMPIMLLGEGRQVLRANRAMCQVLGYTEEELRALPQADELFHPDEPDALDISGALEDGASRAFAHRMLRKDGQAVQVEGSMTAAVTPAGERIVVIEQRDVSEREASRAALEASEARFRAVVETARSGYVAFDAEGTISFANGRFAEMFGYEPQELAGADASVLLPPDDLDAVLALRQALLSGKHLPTEFRARRQRRDGSSITVDVAVSVLRLPGEPDRVLAEMRDVTAEVEAQQALAASEARYRRLVENARNAIVTTDIDGRCVLWNQALRDLTGYEDSDLERMRRTDLTVGDRTRPEQPSDGVSGGSAEEPARSYETAVITRDGRTIPVMMSVTTLSDSGGPAGLLIELVDLRAQLALRDQLIEARKSEALSTLVGGVAHDFNNLLTAIGGSVEMAATTAGDSRWLSNARQATERAADLVRQLRQVARREKPARDLVDLARVTREAADLALQGLESHVRFAIDAPPALPDVRGDRGQLRQVLVNLLMNAREALAGRPDEARSELGSPSIEVRLSASLEAGAGAHVVVRVSDNGPGIPPEVRARIFDPFFTTKDGARGAGLGLATAYGIAREHGGTLEVHSEAGVGTAFVLSLPAAEDASNAAAPLSEPPSAPPRVARVVIVDSDAFVRDTARAILAAEGYAALATESALGAVELLAESSPCPDFVVLEDPGPAASGRWDGLRRLRAGVPGATVILASAYATEEAVRDEGAIALLRKPYTAETLREAIARILGA